MKTSGLEGALYPSDHLLRRFLREELTPSVAPRRHLIQRLKFDLQVGAVNQLLLDVALLDAAQRCRRYRPRPGTR